MHTWVDALVKQKKRNKKTGYTSLQCIGVYPSRSSIWIWVLCSSFHQTLLCRAVINISKKPAHDTKLLKRHQPQRRSSYIRGRFKAIPFLWLAHPKKGCAVLVFNSEAGSRKYHVGTSRSQDTSGNRNPAKIRWTCNSTFTVSINFKMFPSSLHTLSMALHHLPYTVAGLFTVLIVPLNTVRPQAGIKNQKACRR